MNLTVGFENTADKQVILSQILFYFQINFNQVDILNAQHVTIEIDKLVDVGLVDYFDNYQCLLEFVKIV
jgi:hypothetical protein